MTLLCVARESRLKTQKSQILHLKKQDKKSKNSPHLPIKTKSILRDNFSKLCFPNKKNNIKLLSILRQNYKTIYK